MYGKIFESIYDGTLVEDWRALVTFQQMIVLCDADGTIDMTPSAISRRTGIPIEHIKAGIEILENPDPYSRTQGERGSRIKRLDDHRPWGWFIVNHKFYRDLSSQETRREQNRINKQNQRARDNVSNGQRSSAMSHHTDTDTDTDKRPIGRKRAPKGFVLSDTAIAFAGKQGMSREEIQDEFESFKDCEFKSARKDWDAAWRTWCRNWKKWGKNEKAKRSHTESFDEKLERNRVRAGL